MSLFSPVPKKTYFQTKPVKKKHKKKRKKTIRQTTINPHEVHTEVPQIMNETQDFIEIAPEIIPEKPMVQIKHPESSTYYDHIHMFSNTDKKPIGLERIGKKARLEYISSYKYLSKISKTSITPSESTSPVLKYLKKIDERQLLPLPMGIIKRKGNPNDISLGMYSMGDNYAEAFSECIQSLSPERLQLNDNRLSDQGVSKILNKLPITQLIEINLSNNKINQDNLFQLDSIITSKACILQILKLENLNLKDQGCKAICKSLKKNTTLVELDLAKNRIEGNKTLSSFISTTSTLQKLDLHWNNIRAQGGYLLCKALCENTSLKILDLSWNSIGSPNYTNSIIKLSEALSSHKALVHVDLSNNYLSEECIEIISKGLINNHTILGIHMSGNYGNVDELGFLSKSHIRPTSAVKFRRIMGLSRINTMQSWRKVSNCWICERWSPVTFKWTGEKNDPVYLHLSFEDYEADLLEPPDYKITRMCPPGTFFYIFTVNGKVEVLEANVENVYTVAKQVEITQGNVVTIEFDQVNVIKSNPKGPDLLKVHAEPLPRFPHKKYLPAIIKKDWSIADSIFRDYKLDNPELLGKCFEYDWARCKIPKLVKDPLELIKVKDIISKKYPILKEIYKYYSSLSPAGDIWSIGQLVFTDICNESKMIDNTFRLADIDFHLKGALYQEVRNPRSPPNSLVRFQFMEILFRIALDKYFKTGICSSPSEAIGYLLDTNIVPNLGHVSANKWREARYLLASVEKVLKANMIMLKQLYSQFSIRKVKPGQKNFMSLEEFNDMVVKSEVLNENFTAREIGIAFNLAMMTQVQELDVDRQYQMSFLEFLEAIGRVADLVAAGKNSLRENIENLLPKFLWLLPLGMQKDIKAIQ
jgi:NLR family CARD domain-containing protein 3